MGDTTTGETKATTYTAAHLRAEATRASRIWQGGRTPVQAATIGQLMGEAYRAADELPACLVCGANTDGAETHPGCVYDARPATAEERERIARVRGGL